MNFAIGQGSFYFLTKKIAFDLYVYFWLALILGMMVFQTSYLDLPTGIYQFPHQSNKYMHLK